MTIAIIDCYTDEPSGLGVPPYLGTYPRYIYGYLKLERGEKAEDIKYLTIDDLRLYKKYGSRIKVPTEKEKTGIETYNLTVNHNRIAEILENASEIIINAGVHVPGKYLSALPGTIREVTQLLSDVDVKKKTLSGPALYGSQLEGGKRAEKVDMTGYKVEWFDFSFPKIKDYSIAGAEILKQIPDIRMLEIETSRGCTSAKCSFCTEPLKSTFKIRNNDEIIAEMKELNKLGATYFRLGKQACFYSIPKPIELLEGIRRECKIDVLHIDNVNPKVILNERGEKITQAIVKYCTPGNVAAFGVETFDREVSELNTLNTYNEEAFNAVKMINKYGAVRGQNGMHAFLPGINIIFGLMGETRKTHEHNMVWLKKILDDKLLLRRINIRQAAILPGTRLEAEAGDKFLRKNKKYYWKWRNDIRQNIDFPMLKNIVPIGTVMRDVRMEIYDGKTTFGRQLGTYPLIVGIPHHRLELKKFYDIKVTGHMLRSVVGEVV